jgi:antitoxin HicB
MKRSRSITATEYTFIAAFEPADEGGYVVRFPSLPDLVTEGETLDEARAMAADLLTGYLELRQERGKQMLESDAPLAEADPIREPLKVKL